MKNWVSVISCLFLTGCVLAPGEGTYTPYTNQGSFLAQGKPETGTFTLKRIPPQNNYKNPNLRPRYLSSACGSILAENESYQFQLKVNSNRNNQNIEISNLVLRNSAPSSRISKISDNAVQIVDNVSDCMNISSNDIIFSQLIDHTAIVISQSGKNAFAIQITFYDANERTLGKFSGEISTSTFATLNSIERWWNSQNYDRKEQTFLIDVLYQTLSKQL